MKKHEKMTPGAMIFLIVFFGIITIFALALTKEERRKLASETFVDRGVVTL